MSKRRERLQLISLATAAALAWGVAMYFSMVRRGDQDQPVADPTAEPTAAPSGAAGAAAGGTASGTSTAIVATATASTGSAAGPADAASPPATAAPTATPTAAPTPGAPAEDATACVTSLLAPDTFAHGRPDFSFLCTDPYPRHGVTRVQAQVVLGRGSNREMTDGMREWATLGWYQLAAYAVFRGRCCSSPPKLDWTFDLACPLDEAMIELERAVAIGDADAVDAAVERYTKEARCITKLGQAKNFGQAALPGHGMNSFRMVLERLRQAGDR